MHLTVNHGQLRYATGTQGQVAGQVSALTTGRYPDLQQVLDCCKPAAKTMASYRRGTPDPGRSTKQAATTGRSRTVRPLRRI